MSPWSPNKLSAGIDERCRSANENGHYGLKNIWLPTIWHYINKMNGGTPFSTISSRAIVRMQKNTLFLFTEEKTFWLPMTRWSGCWGCRSGYFQFKLNRQHKPKIFQNLQCLTDASILITICKRPIYALTRDRSSDHPFLAYNRPFNCEHFQRPLPVSASETLVQSKVGAPKGKFEIATICMRDPK